MSDRSPYFYRLSYSIYIWVGAIAISGPPFLFFAGGVLVIGFQIFFWLMEGVWTPYELSHALEYFGMGVPNVYPWKGIQMIVDWIFELPLSFSLFIFGIASLSILIWIGGKVGDIVPRPKGWLD